MSQESLAKELGVSFTTINRWEKGHAKPSILFENRFNKYCANKGIVFL
ncbi:MAG: helix-turn-helix domain-containing protein [Clostridiales bacterium]|nr:MAG: helix-turn-helix domain-containing protein [Clostridiales bacterium]